MRFTKCAIPGPMVVEPQVRGDDRGFFFEFWNAQKFGQEGLDLEFVQDNHSRSQAGVLRGLHFQNPNAQGKLVRVISGAAFDVAVDLRRSSPTFGQWISAELTAMNRRMLWVPEGFAHGFLALQPDTELLYKCTALYAPEDEHVLAWNDPQIAIDWPLKGKDPILSEKDASGLALASIPAFP